MPLNESEKKLFTALEIQNPSHRFEKLLTTLTSDIDINTKNRHGKSAFMICVEMSDMNCVQLLLSAKANVNDKDIFGNTALMTAIHNKDITCARLLIEASADIDAITKRGFSALEIAMDQKDFSSLRLLIEKKVHIKNIHELIFLIFDNKQVELLNLLMDVYNNQNYLERIFEGAAHYGYIQVVRKLLAHVSQHVIKHAINLAARNHYVEIIRELYPHVSLSREKLQELLYIAAKNADLTLLNTLLTAKVNVNQGDGFETTLTMAVKAGSSACVKKLVEAKANVQEKSRFGTPLMVAAIHHHANCMQILLEGKANPDQPSVYKAYEFFNHETTPLEYVAEYGDSACMKLLIEYKANLSSPKASAIVTKAAKEGYADLVKLLIDAKANLEKVNTDFSSSLLDNFNRLKKQAECVSLIEDAVSEKTKSIMLVC